MVQRIKNNPRVRISGVGSESVYGSARMVQRNIEVSHREGIKGTQIAVTGLFGYRREYPNVTPASMDRFRRLKARHLVSAGDAEEYAWGIVSRYRYMPEVNIAEWAKGIDQGASNPIGILHHIMMTAEYISAQRGHGAVMSDAAYILMMNQLMFISGLGEVPFEKYRTASAVIDNGEYNPLASA